MKKVKVLFNRTLIGEDDVRFEKGTYYEAIDGADTVFEDLADVVLVKCQDNPEGETPYYRFAKESFKRGLGQIVR